MVPPSSDRIARVPPYSRIHGALRVRDCHPLWPAFPDRSAYLPQTTGLLRFRSPLLAESLLMSFPPGTEMFQFPGFASPPYVFRWRYPKGVGCPIRIPTDQRLLAAPRGFSQRATSFIASWCQGIHRMPFSRSRTSKPPRGSLAPCTGTIPATAATNYAPMPNSRHQTIVRTHSHKERPAHSLRSAQNIHAPEPTPVAGQPDIADRSATSNQPVRHCNQARPETYQNLIYPDKDHSDRHAHRHPVRASGSTHPAIGGATTDPKP